MTKRSELLFLESKIFGKLYYHNVYSFYGEPVIFTATNNYDQKFFCYNLGDEDQSELWTVTPISEKRVNQLEQKDISILKAISATKKDSVLLIRALYDGSDILEEWKTFSRLNYLFPKDDVFITENINLDGKRSHSHKIRVSKSNSGKLTTAKLSSVTSAFTDFLKSLLKGSDAPNDFYPQDAVEGSFVYRVKVENVDSLRNDGYSLFAKFGNRDSLLKLIDNTRLDLRTFRKLLDVQISENLDIELIDEDTTDKVLILTTSNASSLLSEIDSRLSSYLDSTMVPQADDLFEIQRFVAILLQHGSVNENLFKKEKRQVLYYRDACMLLGLIHDYGKLTPNGLKVARSEDPNSFIPIIREQFENTECAYIWSLKQEVDSIIEIDESSAADFLIHNCRGLSESTAKRRAQTLVSWVKQFKKFS
tara:strand:- start:2500 stop:3762 length:1263 start_codon:yes stop_codon:yes gene_type:complete